MLKMKETLLLVIVMILIILTQSSESIQKWTNLKVTFGLNPFEYFNAMPRKATTADRDGWDLFSSSTDCKNDGKFYGFRYITNEDVGLALLYDINGIISGLQMNLLKSEILTPYNHFRYEKVPMFQNDSVINFDVYSITVYFVNPEIICTTGRTAHQLKNEGTGTKLYVQNGPTPATLITIPRNRTEAIAEGWSKNNCFYGMGYHSFYKSEEFANTKCLEFRPIFLLFNNDGDMHGFGLAGEGYGISPRFEHPDGTALKEIIGESVAQCMIDIAQTVRISTMHVYFIDYPYLINCWF